MSTIMDKRELLSYEAPQLEVVEVEVEKGFAASGVTPPMGEGD